MPKSRKPLTRAVILEAALKLLNEEGMAALSMRRVAAAVKVEAMSLYNHVADKQDLLNGVVDLVLSRITPPDPARPWAERLEGLATGVYEALVAHPGLVVVLASEQGTPNDPNVLQGMDSILGALEESGLSPQNQVNAYRSILAMCLGFVVSHTLGLTMTHAQAQLEWEARGSREWDPATLPHLARRAPDFLTTPAGDDFGFMLKAYLDAVRATAVQDQLAKAAARGPRQRPRSAPRG